MDGSSVSSNISHISDKWLDDLHTYIWPDLLIKRAGIFYIVKGFIQGRGYLLVKHMTRHYRQINHVLKDFLK